MVTGITVVAKCTGTRSIFLEPEKKTLKVVSGASLLLITSHPVPALPLRFTDGRRSNNFLITGMTSSTRSSVCTLLRCPNVTLSMECKGNFIYNNYRQALHVIGESAAVLETLCVKLGVTKADLERFLEDERQYLRSRKKEPPEVMRKAEYMLALRRLEEARYVARENALDYLC